MPKSRGRRKPQHRSPRPRTLRTEADVVTDMQKYASFDQNRNPQKDYKSSRSAMVAWSIVHGRRFPIGSVLDNPGPNGEAWTNAWYTAKENRDKGWRYCEGVVKIPDGMMTSAWVIDGHGHLIECSAGIDAEWYQGFVMDETNDMMNQGGNLEWDEGKPRPLVASREDAAFLDGERQLEAVSRLHGEQWLGSMFETAIAAVRDAFRCSYVKALVNAAPQVIDLEATHKFPEAPDWKTDASAFEDIADVAPGNPAEDTQRRRKPATVWLPRELD